MLLSLFYLVPVHLQNSVRREWEKEVQEHNRQREVWRREREEYEREEEGRHKLHFAWDDIRGSDRCLSYEKREYTAELVNVPSTYNPRNACMGQPIDIHGVTLPHPFTCDYRVSLYQFDWGTPLKALKLGRIYGRWIVEKDTYCSSYWVQFAKKAS